MHLSRTCRLPGTVAILLLALASAARAQFDELLRRVPTTANAVVAFDLAKVLASPLAQSEGWKDKYEAAFASGLTSYPPDTIRFVLATQLDFEFMHPMWEVVVAELNRDVSLSRLASEHAGKVSTLEGHKFVSLADDTYVVQLEDRTAGAMAPGNRQAVARWLRDTDAASAPALSPYLTAAVGSALKAGTAITLVIELRDAIPAEHIRDRLADSEALSKGKHDLDKLSELLAGIKGLEMRLNVAERASGKLSIDLSADATPLATLGKPLFMEVLGNHGSMIDDFENWKPRVQGTHLTMEGNLTTSGMRRLMSLLQPPSSLHATVESESSGTSETSTDDRLALYASQQYFHAITSLVDEMVEKAKDSKTIAQNAQWLDRYATKIDKLPLRNVDSELLDFGGYVSQQLRSAAGAVKGIGIRSSAETASVYSVPGANTAYGAYGAVGPYGGYRWGRYGAYGGYGPGNTADTGVDKERRAIRAREKSVGVSRALGVMEELRNATAETRRHMTEKYMADF